MAQILRVFFLHFLGVSSALLLFNTSNNFGFQNQLGVNHLVTTPLQVQVEINCLKKLGNKCEIIESR